MDVYRSLAEVPPAPAGPLDRARHVRRRAPRAPARDRGRGRGRARAGAAPDGGDVRPASAAGADARGRRRGCSPTTDDEGGARGRQLGVERAARDPLHARACRGSPPRTFCRRRAGRRARCAAGERRRRTSASGAGARGDAELAARASPEFETVVVPLVEHGGEPVSSSRIRELVAAGDVSGRRGSARRALPARSGTSCAATRAGASWTCRRSICGRRRVWSIPAAGHLRRRARTATRSGASVPAAVSIGVRPTFEDDGDLRVEAHLIGFDGDLYGRDGVRSSSWSACATR